MFATFISTLGLAFSYDSDSQAAIKLVGRQSTLFGKMNCCKVHTTLAHTQTNYHVSHFAH
jgi:hypothetical protein